jgi:hypothetical protein
MSRMVFGTGLWLPVRAIFKNSAGRGHNLLGVAPAIHKLRVRAIPRTRPIYQIIA